MADLDALRTHVDYLRRCGRLKLADEFQMVIDAFVGVNHLHRCACGATWDEDA